MSSVSIARSSSLRRLRQLEDLKHSDRFRFRSLSPSALYRSQSTSSLSQRGRGQFQNVVINDDIIIPIMGPTGVGKSSMINQLAGKEEVVVGHGLVSCTAEIKEVTIQHPTKENRRIILVDTPGFDDTKHDDVEILKSIADWLTKSYGEGMKIAGIVYLHDISQSRVMGSVRKNLSMFKKLCGDDALKNVVLGTTKWDSVLPELGQNREIQLRDTYWNEMIQHGSVIMQVHANSAWKVVDRILENKPIDGILIQNELMELQMTIPETSAGQELRFTLQQLLEQQKETMRQLAVEGGDEWHKRKLDDNRNQIRATVAQISGLQPINSRLKRWLSS